MYRILPQVTVKNVITTSNFIVKENSVDESLPRIPKDGSLGTRLGSLLNFLENLLMQTRKRRGRPAGNCTFLQSGQPTSGQGRRRKHKGPASTLSRPFHLNRVFVLRI